MTSISEDRRNAAALARDIRSQPLRGAWTRKEWNNQVRLAIRHYLFNAQQFRRANPIERI